MLVIFLGTKIWRAIGLAYHLIWFAINLYAVADLQFELSERKSMQLWHVA